MCVIGSKIVEIMGETVAERMLTASVYSLLLPACPFLLLISVCADSARSSMYWGKPSSLSFSLCIKSFGIIGVPAFLQCSQVGLFWVFFFCTLRTAKGDGATSASNGDFATPPNAVQIPSKKQGQKHLSILKKGLVLRIMAF